MGNFITNEDGYYSLTQTGSVVMLIMVAALVVLTAFLASRAMAVESDKGKTDTAGSTAAAKKVFSTKQLVVSALGIALAFALSYVRLIPMPWGGSVTLCSMLFITIIGFWYGPVIGLTTALAYGLLEFVQDGASYMLNPMQVFLDYIFAFTALGISGFFNRFRNGLTIGYIAAVLARGVFHTIGGYLYWMDYMPDNFPSSLAAVYPLCYNYAYILVEGAITLIVIRIPAVKKAIAQVTAMAR